MQFDNHFGPFDVAAPSPGTPEVTQRTQKYFAFAKHAFVYMADQEYLTRKSILKTFNLS